MVCMDKLTIVVGRSMLDDLRDLSKNPVAKKDKYAKNSLYVKTPQEVLKWISPEKLRILKQVLDFELNLTVSELVQKTGRKQEAISRDLTHLESMGAIKKVKKGRKVFIEPQIDSIEIKFK